MEPAPTWSAGRAVLSCSRQTRICSGAHPALVWRQSRRVGPAADGNAQMSRHSAFADAVSALDEGDFELLRRAVDERCCREKHGFGTLAEAADLYRTDPPAPPAARPRPSGTGGSPEGSSAGAAAPAGPGSPRSPARCWRGPNPTWRPGAASSASCGSTCPSTPWPRSWA